jgi:hypothetical protein
VPDVTNRAKWLVIALCVWTVFVWGNRISNAWSSTTESTSAKVVSTMLAVSFLALAVGGAVVLVRNWTGPIAAGAQRFLVIFAGWTVVVWCVRIVGILADDHGAAFKAVHVALGLISIGLSVGVVRAVRRTTAPAISTAV